MSLSQIEHIVLVLSGKGGVGKSSITTQLALSLSLAGKKVGVLDIDLTGPSIPRFFGLEEAGKVTQSPSGWIPVTVHPEFTISPQDSSNSTTSTAQADSSTISTSSIPNNGASTPASTQVGSLHCMSLGFLLPSRNDAVVWRGPKKTAMVRQFLRDVRWGKLDYLLIDTPPGTSDEHIALAESLITDLASGQSGSSPRQLAGAVVVTTPQAISTADVRKELNFCSKTGIRVLGVVENMAGYVCPCCGAEEYVFSKGGGEVMATEVGVPFLGPVPLDAQFVRLVEEGRRPFYGGEMAVNNANLDPESVDEDARNEEISNQSSEPKEDGKLVEKYMACSLYPVLKKITQKMVDQVEANG
ncbi:MAG: Signal recognition particle [Chaenotheca gracillima]|nr:MAG: Signal recognition particle [Chaenotheca gracillima]